jgi:hypothetical protein
VIRQVAAVALVAFAVLIAVRSVEATVQPTAAAVPVSWLFCDELPASASDAIGRGGAARELTDDGCALLSRWSTPWEDEDSDDE